MPTSKPYCAVLLGLVAVLMVSAGPVLGRGPRSRSFRACQKQQQELIRVVQQLRERLRVQGRKHDITALDDEFWTAAIEAGLLPERPQDPGWGEGSAHHYVLVEDSVFCLYHGNIHPNKRVSPAYPSSGYEELISRGVTDQDLLARAAKLQGTVAPGRAIDESVILLLLGLLFVGVTYLEIVNDGMNRYLPRRYDLVQYMRLALFYVVILSGLVSGVLGPLALLIGGVAFVVAFAILVLAYLDFLYQLLTAHDVVTFFDAPNPPEPEFGSSVHREGVYRLVISRLLASLRTLVFCLVCFSAVLWLGAPRWPFISTAVWEGLMRSWAWYAAIGACTGLFRYPWDVWSALQTPPPRYHRDNNLLRVLGLLVLLAIVSGPFVRWFHAGRGIGFLVTSSRPLSFLAFIIGRHLVLAFLLLRDVVVKRRYLAAATTAKGKYDIGGLQGISSTPSRPLAWYPAGHAMRRAYAEAGL